MSRYDVVLFDLLTGLLDSASLWNAVAGSAADGARWRTEYLRLTYATGPYRPYEALVAEAAAAVGLSPALARALADRYGELQPWPEAPFVLRSLATAGLRLGVVTNCSERLGRIAAGCVGVPFDAVVTAEQAGWYKPAAEPYVMAMSMLAAPVSRCLFVAGSAFDLVGTSRLSLATYWHNRRGAALPGDISPPLVVERSLEPLPSLVLR